MHCDPQLSQGLTVDEKRGLTAAHCVCSSVLLINNGTAEKDSRKTIKAQNPTLRLLTIYSKVKIYLKETKKGQLAISIQAQMSLLRKGLLQNFRSALCWATSPS